MTVKTFQKRTRLEKLTAVQAITLLEKLLKLHGVIYGPECQRLRCECPTCGELYDLFDEQQEAGR